jgi:hypothetical protein
MLDTTRAARNLIVKYRTSENAERPVDRKIATAAFQAQCDILHALGFGMTPHMVLMTVMDTVRSADPRPGYGVVDNSAQQAYDTALAERLGAALDALLEA